MSETNKERGNNSELHLGYKKGGSDKKEVAVPP